MWVGAAPGGRPADWARRRVRAGEESGRYGRVWVDTGGCGRTRGPWGHGAQKSSNEIKWAQMGLRSPVIFLSPELCT